MPLVLRRGQGDERCCFKVCLFFSLPKSTLTGSNLSNFNQFESVLSVRVTAKFLSIFYFISHAFPHCPLEEWE